MHTNAKHPGIPYARKNTQAYHTLVNMDPGTALHAGTCDCPELVRNTQNEVYKLSCFSNHARTLQFSPRRALSSTQTGHPERLGLRDSWDSIRGAGGWWTALQSHYICPLLLTTNPINMSFP